MTRAAQAFEQYNATHSLFGTDERTARMFFQSGFEYSERSPRFVGSGIKCKNYWLTAELNDEIFDKLKKRLKEMGVEGSEQLHLRCWDEFMRCPMIGKKQILQLIVLCG